MAFDPTATAEIPRAPGGPEAPRPFIPTPERVSQYLELKTEEVRSQMESAEGRQTLLNQLLEHEEDLRKDHANFQPELLQQQLDDVAEALGAEGRYLQDIQSPEKKGMFRRAWETVKGFPRKHPVVTALLVAAALAGGVAGGLYLAGQWELLMTSVGLNKFLTAVEAGTEMAPVTPPTPPIPGGGPYSIPGDLPPL